MEPAPATLLWYVVPADDKDNARLIVSQIVLDTFEGLKNELPKIGRKTPTGIASDPQAACDEGAMKALRRAGHNAYTRPLPQSQPTKAAVSRTVVTP
jgi:hypothetical protein